ncbi:MAG: hypothetical protein JXR64_05385 [Spirochaetales bacterium]|nr:hypothetical protein [Spirochaetales bacterium]
MKQNILLFKNNRPETSLVWGYLSYALIGVILLSLPWFRNVGITFIDNLFITISAISTTGLASVSVPDSYSIIGQVVILLLIQLGGIGYMTFGSFVVLSTSQSLSDSRLNVHRTAFSLPKDFSIKKFVKSVVIYTAIVEIIGAIFLTFVFWNDDRANPVWSGIFHSISSFCTAGFSLYNNSFESYANNFQLNIIVSILSFLGAIGYIVMIDVWLLLKGKKNSITFTSKIILGTTFILFFVGAFLLLLENYLKSKTVSNEFIHFCFQSMTALTTVGFNTVPIGELRSFSLFVLLILMIIGASPSGTGGGIKSTTVSSIIGIIKSVFSNHKEYINYHNPITKQNAIEEEKISALSRFVHIFSRKHVMETDQTIPAAIAEDDSQKLNNELNKILGDIFKIKLLGRTIPFDRIIHAIATFAFYFIILFLGVLFLLLSEQFSFEQIFFEAASGLGTVGLSTGITGQLTVTGKIIIILLMFIGRLGPITFGVFLFSRELKRKPIEEHEELVI